MDEDGIQEAADIGEQIKDDLVPLALEYYLGVIDIEPEDDDDEDGDGDGDSDDDDAGKKKKGGKKGKGGAGMPNQKDCKQQ